MMSNVWDTVHFALKTLLLIKKVNNLTAVFFETGAMPVPSKWRNPTICGSGDPFHSYLTHS